MEVEEKVLFLGLRGMVGEYMGILVSRVQRCKGWQIEEIFKYVGFMLVFQE